MTHEPPITEVFARFCELCIARKMRPANEAEGCVELDVDDRWHITFNGHPSEQNADGFLLKPYHGTITYNGWPAGVFSPFGGTVAAGAAANEAALIAAMVAATQAAQEQGGDDAH